jgi:hypothetical protein
MFSCFTSRNELTCLLQSLHVRLWSTTDLLAMHLAEILYYQKIRGENTFYYLLFKDSQ